MDSDRQCTAKSKRSGQRCRRPAARGSNVCHMHGAGGRGTVQRQHAERRAVRMEAHERARRMAVRAGVDTHPIDHLLDSLHQAAAMVAIYGEMVADLDHAGEITAGQTPGRQRGWADRGLDVGPDGKVRQHVDMDPLLVQTSDKTVQLHPFVAEYRHWVSERAKLAKIALDAGVEERRVQLAEREATVVVEAVGRALDDGEAALTAGQQAALRAAIAREFRAIGQGE